MKMTPAQCRAARALLSLEQADIAKEAGVARVTVVDFEKGERTPREKTVRSLKVALETAGIEFIPENGGGAGVRLKK